MIARSPTRISSSSSTISTPGRSCAGLRRQRQPGPDPPAGRRPGRRSSGRRAAAPAPACRPGPGRPGPGRAPVRGRLTALTSSMLQRVGVHVDPQRHRRRGRAGPRWSVLPGRSGSPPARPPPARRAGSPVALRVDGQAGRAGVGDQPVQVGEGTLRRRAGRSRPVSRSSPSTWSRSSIAARPVVLDRGPAPAGRTPGRCRAARGRRRPGGWPRSARGRPSRAAPGPAGCVRRAGRPAPPGRRSAPPATGRAAPAPWIAASAPSPATA